MSKICFVGADGLAGFLSSLTQKGYQVLTPHDKPATSKPVTVFETWKKGEPVNLKKAMVSPKGTVLPECEILFRFKNERNPKDLNDTILTLKNDSKSVATVVFGCRPCDARGFAELDKPYLNGLYIDPYYKQKRDNLTVISFTCDTGCETCFCHWVGGGPSSPIGSDILLTLIEDGYVFQAITEKGQELLGECSLQDGTDKFSQVTEKRKKAWQSLVPAPDLKEAPKSLKDLFSNDKFWIYWTNRCISCGACTYFCPTCYCFNITDEGDASAPAGGRRLRSWDNCMSSRYTREASGHNPRPEKYERMRNRISHKFWTFYENWGEYLCSGCGRCITNCPVHLDIREITLAAIKEYSKKEEGN